jgi:hypothetical protein
MVVLITSVHIPGCRQDYSQTLGASFCPKRSFVEDCRDQGLNRSLGSVEHARVAAIDCFRSAGLPTFLGASVRYSCSL